MPDPNVSLPAFQYELLPLDGVTLRATGFAIEFDGGAFVLKVFEMREDPAPRTDAVATKRRNVEIARFAVSPVALQWLGTAVNDAANTYKSAMAHDLPDQQAVLKALQTLALEERKRNAGNT